MIGTILGHFLGHIRPMFWLFLPNLCFQMPKIAQILTKEPCIPNRRIPFNVKLLGPYESHVGAILGPCFDYIYNIFASRCLIWLKFSLESHASQIEKYQSMSNYWDQIRAIFKPYKDHVQAILGQCLDISTISLLLYDWNGSTFH